MQQQLQGFQDDGTQINTKSSLNLNARNGHYQSIKYFPIPLSAQALVTIQLLPLHSFADLSQALEELSNGVICMGGEDNVEMGVICVLLTSQSVVPPNLLQRLYIDIEQAG